jgi:beta-fructofuranosidase
LLFKPVPEAVAVFTKTVEEISDVAEGLADVPDNYYLECQVELEPQAELQIVMRKQISGKGYALSLRPAKGEGTISGPKFDYPRKVRLDASNPVTVQAFVQGSIIECFVNEAYAFSCRAYDFRSGKLGVGVTGGKGHIRHIAIKIP